MAHSFSQLLRRVDGMWQKFMPWFYYGAYWFGFNAIILVGKSLLQEKAWLQFARRTRGLGLGATSVGDARGRD